jgi:hypothetical protein
MSSRPRVLRFCWCRVKASCVSQVVALSAVPFKFRLERNKSRCEARRDVPAVSKTLALAKAARPPMPTHSCFSNTMPRTMSNSWANLLAF